VRGEIFGLNRRIVSVDSVISKIWNYQPKHIQWAGFKLFYNHLFHERHKGLYQKILKNKAVRIIHLKRRNLVKAEISAALARQTGIWHGKFENNQREGIKIYMHPDTLAANLNMTLENYERIKSLLKNHEIIEVIYEDLVEELSQTMKEIYRFLNIKDHTFQTPFLKQSTESIESLVENHQELRNYFQGTRWYKYFE
jgi:LPS sulfotransferase NodH